MHVRSSLLALLALLVLPASRALAQDACHVAVGDLTVNDEAPPEQYRELLANGIRPTIDPILQCYRDRIAARPGLQGNLQLRLWVSARQVIRVTPETNTLEDPTLEQCAIARIREFRLPPEAPEGGARVRFVLRFTTTGAAATAGAGTATAGAGTGAAGGSSGTAPATGSTAPAQTTTPGTTTPGTAPLVAPRAPLVITIPPSVAAAMVPPRASVAVGTIRGAMGADVLAHSIPGNAFDACPAGSGTIDVRLSVNGAGTMRARAAGGSIRDRATQRCVVDALRALHVPPAAGTTRATITITLAR